MKPMVITDLLTNETHEVSIDRDGKFPFENFKGKAVKIAIPKNHGEPLGSPKVRYLKSREAADAFGIDPRSLRKRAYDGKVNRIPDPNRRGAHLYAVPVQQKEDKKVFDFRKDSDIVVNKETDLSDFIRKWGNKRLDGQDKKADQPKQASENFNIVPEDFTITKEVQVNTLNPTMAMVRVRQAMQTITEAESYAQKLGGLTPEAQSALGTLYNQMLVEAMKGGNVIQTHPVGSDKPAPVVRKEVLTGIKERCRALGYGNIKAGRLSRLGMLVASAWRKTQNCEPQQNTVFFGKRQIEVFVYPESFLSTMDKIIKGYLHDGEKA